MQMTNFYRHPVHLRLFMLIALPTIAKYKPTHCIFSEIPASSNAISEWRLGFGSLIWGFLWGLVW